MCNYPQANCISIAFTSLLALFIYLFFFGMSPTCIFYCLHVDAVILLK